MLGCSHAPTAAHLLRDFERRVLGEIWTSTLLVFSRLTRRLGKDVVAHLCQFIKVLPPSLPLTLPLYRPDNYHPFQIEIAAHDDYEEEVVSTLLCVHLTLYRHHQYSLSALWYPCEICLLRRVLDNT